MDIVTIFFKLWWYVSMVIITGGIYEELKNINKKL